MRQGRGHRGAAPQFRARCQPPSCACSSCSGGAGPLLHLDGVPGAGLLLAGLIDLDLVVLLVPLLEGVASASTMHPLTRLVRTGSLLGIVDNVEDLVFLVQTSGPRKVSVVELEGAELLVAAHGANDADALLASLRELGHGNLPAGSNFPFLTWTFGVHQCASSLACYLLQHHVLLLLVILIIILVVVVVVVLLFSLAVVVVVAAVAVVSAVFALHFLFIGPR